ncbi:MAG: ATP-binding cassette domain-containing protein, partial [Clostridia bacterium]|nr:ATP-binding cassette domain-containing protein [Clostridia bacterium]
AQLDPIAAQDFLHTLAKINRELGTAVLLTEHRLEEVLPLADRLLVLEQGRLISDGPPRQIARQLQEKAPQLFATMPTPLRIWSRVENDLPCPLTVREGQEWLAAFAKSRPLLDLPEQVSPPPGGRPLLALHDISFRYSRDCALVLDDFSLQLYAGEIYALMGGNGAGKSTALLLAAGIRKPERGRVEVDGQENTAAGFGGLALLPQNHQTLFVKKSVAEDLAEALEDRGLSGRQKEARISAVCRLLRLQPLLPRHPYDLSGGEQQMVAVAKALLISPRILLLDEPTKGLDNSLKERLAQLLLGLKAAGVAVLIVSHDIEFCARYADRCGLLFDGAIVASAPARDFFAGQHFYTTAANRLARHLLPRAILDSDVVAACGGPGESAPPACAQEDLELLLAPPKADCAGDDADSDDDESRKPPGGGGLYPRSRLSRRRLLGGMLLLALFILTAVLGHEQWSDWRLYLYRAALALELALALIAFFPGRAKWSHIEAAHLQAQQQLYRGGKLGLRSIVGIAIIMLLMPLTIWAGLRIGGDRQYLILSMVLAVEAVIPFVLAFEGRRPQAREIVVIAVLIGLAVASRAALFMLPQFKPVLAIIIIAGISLGGRAGFLVGSMTALISNFFLGQGAWTAWQMFTFGLIGLIAGSLFARGWLPPRRGWLAVFGAVITLVVYGGIMNFNSVLLFAPEPTWGMIITTYALGLPFDLIHAAGTAFFLWIAALPLLEKLERVKSKYGLLE